MARTAFPKPIPFSEETLSCHLTAVTACSTSTNKRTYYAYTIALPHPFDSCPAHMLVPSTYVIPATQCDVATFSTVHLYRSASTAAIATLGPVIAENLAENIYIRRLLVSYKALVFRGEVHIPRSGRMIKRVEEATAVQSIEEVPAYSPGRRVVSFKGAWTFVEGKGYDVEVWSLDGEEVLEGKAKVVRVVDVEKVEGGGQDVRRVVLRTQVPDDKDEMLLVGDLKKDMRTGPFDEVEVEE